MIRPEAATCAEMLYVCTGSLLAVLEGLLGKNRLTRKKMPS